MEPFAWMASELLPLVAGTQYSYGKEKFTKCISFGGTWDCNGLQLVSITDEALTLFLYKNYFNKWVITWKNENKLSPEHPDFEVPFPKYTKPKSGNTHGWSIDGIKRFNEICHQVVEERSVWCKEGWEGGEGGLEKSQRIRQCQKALAKSAAASKEMACVAKKRERLAAFIG